jgi:hypothetical protein
MPITDAPYELEPTGQPISFEIEAEEYESTPGGSSVSTLEFPSLPTAGQTLILAYGSKVITFTFAATTPKDGITLPLSTDHGKQASYLSTNYELINDFVIRSTGTAVELTGRKLGSDYDITATGTYTSTLTNLTAGVDRVVNENHKVIAALWATSTNSDIGQAFVLEQSISVNDATHKGRVDMARFLHNLIQVESFKHWETAPYELTAQPISYLIRYGEAYGIPQEVKRFAASQKRWAWRAKLKYDDIELYDDYNVATHYEENWCTNQPSDKVLSRSELDALTFINANSYSGIDINVSAVLSTGATATGSIAFSLSDSNPKLVVIPISHSIIAALVSAGVNQVVSFNISVGVSGTRKTRIMRYKFVDHCPGYRYYMYLNSVGGWESMRTNAVFSKAIRTNQDTYTRPYTKRYEETEEVDTGVFDKSPRAEIMAAEAIQVESHTGASGAHEQEWAEHFCREFSASQYRFEYVPEDSRMIPIIVTTKDFTLKTRASGNHFFRFAYSHAYTDGNKASAISSNGRDASFTDTDALPND